MFILAPLIGDRIESSCERFIWVWSSADI